MKKPKILHLITSLNIGGTEQFLLNIVNNLKSKYDFTVGYLKKIGEIAKEIDAGIPIYKFDYFLLKKYLKEKKIRYYSYSPFPCQYFRAHRRKICWNTYYYLKPAKYRWLEKILSCFS